MILRVVYVLTYFFPFCLSLSLEGFFSLVELTTFYTVVWVVAAI